MPFLSVYNAVSAATTGGAFSGVPQVSVVFPMSSSMPQAAMFILILLFYWCHTDHIMYKITGARWINVGDGRDGATILEEEEQQKWQQYIL